MSGGAARDTNTHDGHAACGVEVSFSNPHRRAPAWNMCAMKTSLRPFLDRSGLPCLVLLLIGVGCSEEERLGEQGPAFEESVIDGVRTVENVAPAWADGEGWQVDPVPMLEIGADEEDPNQHFFSIQTADRLQDGRLVVLDRGSRDARFFSPSGEFLHVVGGPGDGPGEFERIRSFARCGNDTLVVGELSRVSLLDSEGRFLRTELVTPRLSEVPLGVWGASSDCSDLLLLDRPSVAPLESGYRRPLVFYWANMATTTRDTVGSFPGHLLISIPQADVRDIPVPFSATTESASRGDVLYLGYSGAPEIQVYERGRGLIEVRRWEVDRREITSADRTRFSQFRDGMVGGNPAMERIMPPLDGYPLEPFKPIFARLLADDEGNLWVQEYPEWAAGFPAASRTRPGEGTPPESWWIFDSGGRLLGSVSMPPELEVHRISGGMVVGVYRSDLDVELVRLHPIWR